MLRWKLMGALLVVVLLGGGWLWLRDSPVFAVDQVSVRGVQGASALLIRDSLDNAARTMTTTDFDVAKLRAAVARFPLVQSVSAATRFPHGVVITVVERRPVAALVLAGRRVPVAADGTVLPGLYAADSLPAVTPTQMPAGQRLTDRLAAAAVTLLAAAPDQLRARVVSVGPGPSGLAAFLRNGPPLYFGDATRAHAKWAAAAAVLADPGSAGAQYIDVRIPERPVAQVGDAATSTANASSQLPGAASDPSAAGSATPGAGASATAQPSIGG